MTQIYLISPPQINLFEFAKELDVVLKTAMVPVFQLRLKDCEKNIIKKNAQELIKICKQNNCLFILNDDLNLALELEADGVHLGIDDWHKLNEISQVKSKHKNFIIGASCYDSKHLAMQAGENDLDYISFGAFFPSKTKISRGSPDIDLLDWAIEMLNLPVVGIGGINSQNCLELIKHKIDFMALISFIWQHPKGSLFAVKEIHNLL